MDKVIDKVKKHKKIILGVAMERVFEYFILFLLSSATLGAIGKLLSDWLSERWPITAQYDFFIVSIFALAGGLISFYLLRHFDRNIPHYKRFDFNFRVEKKEIIFEFKKNSNGDKVTYIKKYTLIPLKHNLKVFEDKYSWTGKVHDYPVSEKSDQKYKIIERKGTWQPYNVEFDKLLNKNKPIDIEGKWNLNNATNAVPFIGAIIEHPTKKLILKLKVSEDLKIKYANCEIFCGMGVLISCGESKTLRPDKEGNFEWVIDSPKLLHYYELSWSHPN